MDFAAHGRTGQSIAAVQAGSRTWWSSHPMTYDWHGTLRAEIASREWFDEMDRRFIQASFPYVSRQRPFDRVMPDSLKGKKVLEIGCGMGLHTEELIKRGAEVTAIDLTDSAVRITKSRLAVKNLTARVQQADAEDLPFDDGEFDFVWSWGVIHHSSRTARAVRQISRVLSPLGEARAMVYNRDALITRILLARHYILGGGFLRKTPDEVLWEHADGFIARYFHRDQLEDLFRGVFEDSHASVLGQESDVVPLPRRLRRPLVAWLGDQRRVDIAARWGSFLFVTAHRPL